MAREVAAITHGTLRDPVKLDLLPKGKAPVEIAIEDFALCPRYSALVFENVTVQPSPLWLQYRLEAIGLNAINNIVDVTNYVMAELAQPMHAFDADKLHGPTIFVRNARPGEQIVALNDESYDLEPVESGDRRCPGRHCAGGRDRRIAQRDRSRHQAHCAREREFPGRERSQDIGRAEAAHRCIHAIRESRRIPATRCVVWRARWNCCEQVSPGIRLVGGLADSHAGLKTPAPIELTVDWLKAKLGRELNAHEVRSILESLEFGVEETAPGHFLVTVPSWRATKDISIKDDLLEEVGRMVGYDSITPQAPLIESVVPPENPSRIYLRGVRNMAAAQGFTEVYNYSFVTEDMVRAFGMDAAGHVRVTNPIASDQTLLRASLLPAIRKNILDNSRHFQSFSCSRSAGRFIARDRELPEEVPHFVAAMYAREGDGSASLFELKRLAECLMDGCEARLAKARAFEHPERAAIIAWHGEDVGRLFELHPSLGIEGRAAILDLDLAKMEKLDTREDRRYQTLRRFPVSAFDLSVVAGLREPSGQYRTAVGAAAGSDLVEIEFLREYTGDPLPPGSQECDVPADRRRDGPHVIVGGSGRYPRAGPGCGYERCRISARAWGRRNSR